MCKCGLSLRPHNGYFYFFYTLVSFLQITLWHQGCVPPQCLSVREGHSDSGHNEPEKTPQVRPHQVTAVVGPVTGSGKDLLECSALCTKKTHKLNIVNAHLNLVVAYCLLSLCKPEEFKMFSFNKIEMFLFIFFKWALVFSFYFIWKNHQINHCYFCLCQKFASSVNLKT